MRFEADIHTHTIASGHAFSSLEEMVRAAKNKGLKVYGFSDHAPALPGGAHIYYFQNLVKVPPYIDGLRVLRGVEANIINYDGGIDMIPESMKHIDYVIASIHPPTFASGTVEENTRAVCKAMENPRIKVIGHPDDGRAPLDYEVVVQKAKKEKVLLELNNSSLHPQGFRDNVQVNVRKYLRLCKEHDVPIIVNSDAHISMDVGVLNYAEEVLKEMDFPERLIMNSDADRLMKFLGCEY